MDAVVASYNDFEGLAKLRAKAQQDEMAAAREVGQQFEAFFIKSMLSCRVASTNPPPIIRAFLNNKAVCFSMKRFLVH